LRLALVAGVRREVAARFEAALDRAGVRDVPILLEPDVPSYLRAFDRLLAGADLLWSKPSEISFFAALGLPLIVAPPVGVHEGYNRRWVLEAGAGVAQDDPALAGGWLLEKIEDGTLAACAWSGATRLPSDGVYRIAEAVRSRTAS
jgi:UDP-N-acetylglucosamine:LPS N-acetylglucosamine transferase